MAPRWGENGDMDFWSALAAGQVSVSERRAVRLLSRLVDPYRFSLYCVTGELPCRGNVTGATFLVLKSGGAWELGNIGPRYYWCISVGPHSFTTPPTDHVVALRALLEGEELAFRATGNRSSAGIVERLTLPGVVEPHSEPWVSEDDLKEAAGPPGFLDWRANEWLRDEWDSPREHAEYAEALARDLPQVCEARLRGQWRKALVRHVVRPQPPGRPGPYIQVRRGRPRQGHAGIDLGDGRHVVYDQQAAQYLWLHYGINIRHELQMMATAGARAARWGRAEATGGFRWAIEREIFRELRRAPEAVPVVRARGGYYQFMA